MESKKNLLYSHPLNEIKEKCTKARSKEEIYNLLVKIARNSPKYSHTSFTEKDLVMGCQSTTFIQGIFREGKVFFQGTSDALITQGILQLLFWFYEGEPFKKLLTQPPHFMKEWGILSSLSMNRANGAFMMHQHMQKIMMLKLKGSSL